MPQTSADSTSRSVWDVFKDVWHVFEPRDLIPAVIAPQPAAFPFQVSSLHSASAGATAVF